MTLTPDQERWAEASAIYRLHGDRAELRLAERVGSLALAGDVAGVERFRQVATKLDQLVRPGSTGSAERH